MATRRHSATAHPETEDLEDVIRIDASGIAVISTPPILTGNQWHELRAALAEAIADRSTLGVVIVVDAAACQVCGAVDDFIESAKRLRKVKPIAAHIDRAYGSALIAALACETVAATADSRLGLLTCDYPFLDDPSNHPPLSYFENMLAADFASARPQLSEGFAGSLISKSIDGIDAH